MRMGTSADPLHVHPLRMQPRDAPKLLSFFVLTPLDEAGPRLGKSPEGETQ